jgi:hypothetical protein
VTDEFPRCTWAIKFGVVLHTRCARRPGHDGRHQGRGLKRFAYQIVQWLPGDAREYETDRVDKHAWSDVTEVPA